jgi:putative PEP-CTERM system TPR-repeat lipoprotein
MFFGSNRRDVSISARLVLAVALVWLLAACGQVAYTVEERIERGWGFEQQGDLAAASIEYRNALQSDPNSAEGRFRLGMLLLKAGDVAPAEQELKRAQQAGWEPDAVRLPLLRAALLQDRYGRVLEETRLIESFPESQVAEALAYRGLALVGIGNSQAALESLESALERQPGLVDAQIGMALVAAATGEGTAAARPWLERAVADNPDSYQAWGYLGDLEHTEGNNDAAIIAYGKAIKAAPSPYLLHFRRAIARLAQNDVDGAEQDLRALRRAGANLPTTHYVDGLIHYYHRRLPEARLALETTLNSAPGFDQAMLVLGTVHMAQENWEQAEHHLRRYLARNPQSTEGQRLLAMLRLQDGDLARAEDLLKSVLARTPEDVQALGMMGRLNLAQGERDAGIQQLRQVAALRPHDLDTRSALAAELLRSGELDEGILELEAIIGDSPDSPPALEATLIVNLLRAGESSRALDAAERMAERFPENPLPQNLKAAAFLAMNDLIRGAAALQEALRIDPGNPPATMVLARMAQLQGDGAEARRLFEEALEHRPDHLDILMQLAQMEVNEGDPAAAVEFLERAVRSHPDALAPRVSLARYFLQNAEPERTVALLEPLREPSLAEDLRVLDLLARAYLATGQDDRALGRLQRLADVLPDDPGMRFRLASAFIQAGGTDEAREQLRLVLDREPDNLAALRLLADLTFAAGDFEEAAALGRRIQLADSGLPDGYIIEARAQLATGHGDRAMEQLRDRVAAHPDESATRGLLAQALLQAEDYEGAIAEYERLNAAQPENFAILNNLAWLYQRQGNPKALDYAERAFALQPDNPAVTDTLGWILVQEGTLERGVTLLQRAHQAVPDDPEIWYHFAYGLNAQGRHAEARQQLTALLESTADFARRSEAEQLLESLR